ASPGSRACPSRCAAAVLAALLALAYSPCAVAAPTQPVRMIAEWEPAWGALVRWPLNIPVELVREISEDDTVYTLVEGSGNENQARSTFESAGVVMDHVRFIQTDVYSSWTRDWGPQCVFDGQGQMGITDPWFDGYPWVSGCESRESGDAMLHVAKVARRCASGAVASDGLHGSRGTVEPSRRVCARGYEDDDVIPGDVAAFLDLPHHLMPAYCTGGNIMTDGHGRAFSTQQMLLENAPYMSEAAFRSAAESYLGITDYQFLPNPEIYGIQHIDCYAKLLDEETVLVKELPTWHAEYWCVEDLVDAFASLETCYGRPYEIVRVYCEPYYGDEVAAYTNSLILNGKVLVPTFGVPADADALATYEAAMPGYEVIGVDYGGWLYYDALHCRTMGIFDAGMLRLTHAPPEDVVPAGEPHEIVVTVEPMSGGGLVPGAQVVRWRIEGDAGWNEEPLGAAAGDTFIAYIPAQSPGDVVEYHVAAADSSGRSETLPGTAPEGCYSFQIDPAADVPSADDVLPNLALHVTSNPFRASTAIEYSLPGPCRVSVAIYDSAGRLVERLADGEQTGGRHRVVWWPVATDGRALASGVYLVRVEAERLEAAHAKLIHVR
ncbi:MAG: hypothetical protein GF400_08210, partial [Candidatus Eisenbacteria bacterium]|nr:hypothetical protein [Candidatus Eisenbacteria bacterium]